MALPWQVCGRLTSRAFVRMGYEALMSLDVHFLRPSVEGVRVDESATATVDRSGGGRRVLGDRAKRFRGRQMNADRRTPNLVLRGIRERERHQSREEFARALNERARLMGENVSCDARLVARWEDGEVRNPRPVYRRILSAETGRPYGQLGFLAVAVHTTGDVPRAVGGTVEAVLGPQALSALSEALLLPPVEADELPASLVGLRAGVLTAWRLRQRAEYGALGALLPGLLTGLHRAAVAADDGQTERDAIVLLVHALNATSSLLKKANQFDLALVAADRAVRSSTEAADPVLTAAAVHRLANVLLPAGRLDDCRRVALSAADSIHPGAMPGRTANAMWGSLLLTAAVAAARNGDQSSAWELMGEARTAGRLVGQNFADLHTIFGPTNIAMHGVQVAVELRDGHDAIRRGDHVRVDALPADLIERRGQFLLDLTAGSAIAGDFDRASALLFQAESVAPEEVRFSPAAHEVLSVLLSRPGVGSSSPLRDLAGRMAYGG